MNAAELSSRLAEQAEDVARYLLPQGKRKGPEWKAGNTSGEEGDSLSVRLTGAKAGVWKDFAGGDGGDLIDLWMACRSESMSEALKSIKQYLGVRDNAPKPPEKVYRRPEKPRCKTPRERVREWLTALATLDGRVFVRSIDVLYEVSATKYTDDEQLIPVEVQMAFQDAKSPGVNKQVWGADLVAVGNVDFSLKYDPRDLAKESVPQTVSGDTRPGDMEPIEIMAPAIAPVFRHARDEPFELDALSLYFYLLGPQ